MKTRRFIAVFAALTMAAAIGSTSVFAVDDTTLDKDNASGTTTVDYDAEAKYTVTIPAGVTLSETETVTKNIAASDVRLESGQKIKVTLYGASNTESGSTFNAKTEAKDSTATYTITAGENAVEVGGTVAEFTENGDQTLTFSKAEGATLAGKHTEVLTFGVSVEGGSAPIEQKTLTIQKTSMTDDKLQLMEGTLSLDYTSTNKWSDVCTAMSKADFVSIAQSMLNGQTVSVDTGWYSTSIPTSDGEFSGVFWIDAQDGIYSAAMLDTQNQSVEPVVPDSEILEGTQYVAIAQILVNH